MIHADHIHRYPFHKIVRVVFAYAGDIGSVHLDCGHVYPRQGGEWPPMERECRECPCAKCGEPVK